MRTNKFTHEKLIYVIKNSTSIAETMRNLGLKPKGGYYTKFHQMIKEKKYRYKSF